MIMISLSRVVHSKCLVHKTEMQHLFVSNEELSTNKSHQNIIIVIKIP